MEKIQAVIFDLYGTLLYLSKSSNPYFSLFKEIGLTNEELKKAKRIAITQNFDNLSNLLKKLKREPPNNLNLYEQEINKEISSAKLYPETLNVLSKLRNKKLKIGLISNLASPYKKPFFNFRLDNFFDELIFSCDMGLQKPEKRIYQSMIEKLNIAPANMIMTGDKINADFDGPKSVGMNAVHLNRLENSTGSISTLEGIFDYL
jgi:putative hydrolase of the HAD superfamily